MYCKNCGKDIEDAKFCQYCGKPNNENLNVTVNVIQKDLLTTVKGKIKQIGQGKLIKLITIIATIINIIIRIVNNEIKVVYSLLSQEDYFVVSEKGRTYMLIIIVLEIITTFCLYKNAKKDKTKISKGTFVLLVFSLIIQILAMLLQLPAPY